MEPSEKPGDPAWLERLPPGDREHVRAQLARIRARRPRRAASERAWRGKHGLAGGGIVRDDLMDEADTEGPGGQERAAGQAGPAAHRDLPAGKQ